MGIIGDLGYIGEPIENGDKGGEFKTDY